MSLYGGFDYDMEHRGVYGPIDYDRMRNIALKTADVVVYLDDNGNAVAVDKHGNKIAESTDHASVWRQAVEAAPDHGVVAGLGDFLFKGQVSITKPLTIVGGKFVRDPSIGTNSHSFFNVGNNKGEPLLDGPVRFINCYFDGNERNISQKYTEAAGAPVHVGVSVLRARKVEFIGNVFKDMAREAIWITCVDCESGIIDHEEIIIVDNYFENVAYGVTAEAYDKIIFSRNIVKGNNANGDPGKHPNYVFSANYLDCLETVFTENIIDGMVPDGYPYAGTVGRTAFIRGNAAINKAVIANNIISNFSIGLYPIANGRYIIIGNYISDVGTGINAWSVKNSLIAFNQIRRFSGTGIYATGASEEARFEHNLVAFNYLDPEDKTPDYAIYVWDYAKHNIIVGNVIANATYNTAWAKIWLDVNLSDVGVYGTDQLNTIQSELDAGLYPLSPWIPHLLYYDGTYYYLVVVDLAAKKMYKVQLS